MNDTSPNPSGEMSSDTEAYSNAASSQDSNGPLINAGDSTLLEYARSHGLCTDYRTFDPLALDIMKPFPPDFMIDESGLHQTKLPEGLLDDRKLLLDTEAVRFLQYILGVGSHESVDIDSITRTTNFLRAESPLVLTDTALDFRLFSQKPKFSDVQLSSERVDPADVDMLDADLDWLDSDVVTSKNLQASTERLQLTMNDMLFLRLVCESGSTSQDHISETMYEPERHKVRREHETPPLLPRSSPFSLEGPTSPVGLLRLASSPPDPTKDILEQLDARILYEEPLTACQPATGLFQDSVLDSEDQVQVASPIESTFSSPIKRQRPEDFKEEVPLSPKTSQSSPLKRSKTVTFAETLVTAIPSYARVFSPGLSDDLDEDHDNFLDKTTRSEVEAAIMNVEHEQLCDADSVMRVEVPVIDHSMPPPPWDCSRPGLGDQATFHTDYQRKLLSSLKLDGIHADRLWTRDFDHHIKAWSPFPGHPGKAAVNEVLDKSSLDQYIVTSSICNDMVTIWKPEGLRILDVKKDEDDELDSANYDGPNAPAKVLDDLQSLLVRHQRALKGEHQSMEKHTQMPALTAMAKSEINSNYFAKDAKRQTGDQDMPLDAFSATTSLSRFMQTHTNNQLMTKPPSINPNTIRLEGRPKNATLSMKHEDAEEDLLELFSPVPKLPSSTPKRQFILALTLFSRQGLIREIKKLYLNSQLIERDFESGNSTRGDGSVLDIGEADLLLSPGAGLLILSLQQIKQKPLPGQTGYTGILGRIANLANRYEQLIVLISEGQSISSASDRRAKPGQNFDQRDCAALSSLIHFATQLDAEVQVVYVPGNEESLASWIVSCMIRYGTDDPKIQLTSDETLWEIVLRRVGLNAFAAQAILIALKAPIELSNDALNAVGSAGFGLAAFVSMRHKERKQRFTSMLGGERLLNRVGKVIEMEWGRVH